MKPLKAIKAKCLDCCANQPKEVELCEFTDCPLWWYRMGHPWEVVLRRRAKWRQMRGEKPEFSEKETEAEEVIEGERE